MAQQTKPKRQRIDYEVAPLKAEHIAEAKEILVEGFTGRKEPLCMGCSAFEFGLLMQYVLNLSLVFNTTSVAIEKKTNKVMLQITAFTE